MSHTQFLSEHLLPLEGEFWKGLKLQLLLAPSHLVTGLSILQPRDLGLKGTQTIQFCAKSPLCHLAVGFFLRAELIQGVKKGVGEEAASFKHSSRFQVVF